jgi:hypothetical protein
MLLRSLTVAATVVAADLQCCEGGATARCAAVLRAQLVSFATACCVM